MPELPEVETVARQLAPLVVGQSVTAVSILDSRLGSPNTFAPLVGRTIQRAWRIGKQIAIEFSPRAAAVAVPPTTIPTTADADARPLWVGVHLRMTGRLLAVSPTDASVVVTPFLRARMVFASAGELRFADQRRFGTIAVVPDLMALQPVGLDPLDGRMTVRRLSQLLLGSSSRQALKVWLLRQDKLVGIGNIYASEILFDAKLHPERPANSLSAEEIARLAVSIRRILRRAIAHCGTTFSDFQDAHGLTGSYQKYLRVYDRAGADCRLCGTPIRRLVQAQRSTFFCPTCQPHHRHRRH